MYACPQLDKISIDDDQWRKLMNWEAIAAIAELLAAIGVIISLIFVGLQIRMGNGETRASTTQAASDAEAFMNATLINHRDIWDKIVTGAPLESGPELRGGILLYNLTMVNEENRFLQFQSGFLDAQSWAGHRSNLQTFVTNPFFKIWRESRSAKVHTAEFLNLVDNFAEEAPIE